MDGRTEPFVERDPTEPDAVQQDRDTGHSSNDHLQHRRQRATSIRPIAREKDGHQRRLANEIDSSHVESACSFRRYSLDVARCRPSLSASRANSSLANDDDDVAELKSRGWTDGDDCRTPSYSGRVQLYFSMVTSDSQVCFNAVANGGREGEEVGV